MELKLDTSKSDRKLWLVKVPNYIAEHWKAACNEPFSGNLEDDDAGRHLGTVHIETDTMKGKTNLRLELPGPGSARAIPGSVPTQYYMESAKDLLTTYAFTHCPGGEDQTQEAGCPRVEGCVDVKFDLVPIFEQEGAQGEIKLDPAYVKYSRERSVKATTKVRQVQRLKDDDTMMMNTVNPALSNPNMAKRRVEPIKRNLDNKRVAKDKEELERDLFQLFETQSHWSFSQLMKETYQPGYHLKRVLNEIAVLNKRGPHKDLYELKKEFRSAAPPPTEHEDDPAS